MRNTAGIEEQAPPRKETRRTDAKGRKTAAVSDFKKHKRPWEDIEDVLASRSRRFEKRIPLER